MKASARAKSRPKCCPGRDRNHQHRCAAIGDTSAFMRFTQYFLEGEIIRAFKKAAIGQRADSIHGTPIQQSQVEVVVATRDIAVIVLRGPSNRLRDLRPLVPQLASSLSSAKRGDVLWIGE